MMGLPPAELPVAGDFRFDIMAGHAAGATTALLVYRDRSPMQEGGPVPDYIIRGMREIHNILR